jgi:hypothetical protein
MVKKTHATLCGQSYKTTIRFVYNNYTFCI